MIRGTDYEWSNTTGLPERDFECGFCGGNITCNIGFTGWHRVGGAQPRQDIYICHKCGKPNLFRENKQYPVYKGNLANFPEIIKDISSKFVEIHRQAETAETEDLGEISGIGYGKALEFLIKDYLIKLFPDKEEIIKKKKLYDCIHELVDNPKIKALAEKARLIRNDETHYERKLEDSDIKDLKKLILATVAWIELEYFTAEVSNENNSKKTKEK